MYIFFFFFQAEDGIRDIGVTGVQTCALPICPRAKKSSGRLASAFHAATAAWGERSPFSHGSAGRTSWNAYVVAAAFSIRSEERRVGKECRSRWSPYH